MSDKQLTVAELLARSGRDTGDSKTPRPRRRRSLEEGGISVAELTGSIPAVKAKPAESRHSSVPIDAPEGETTTPAAQVSDKQDKQELSPVDRTAAKVAEKQAEKAEKAEEPAKAEASAKTVTPTPGTDETVVFQKVPGETAEAPAPETGEMPAVKTAAATSTASTSTAVATAEDVEKQEESDALEVTEDAEDVEEMTSVTGVILMALIGIVLGVVVFKGFELLWESFSRPVVAALAVLATVGIVGVVKALRTANDGLSMFLAGLVGLVMTFGPLAVVLI
ncbi:MAG: hypothetical protein GX859_02555 [Corynebacterium humireducens]|uniref:Uncharacterized protein n=1 Tax=Corynebacterium humireducens TaxID=1223514 RepID=A0A7X6SV80_9CORY|nr:hypothetical protein [Corynebacterium humireducens]